MTVSFSDSVFRQRAAVADEFQALDARLADCARDEPQVKLLMTLPGVNYFVALGLLAAFGDVSRFKDGDRAASLGARADDPAVRCDVC